MFIWFYTGVWCWCSLGTSICWLADYHWRWSTSPNLLCLDPVSSAIIVQGSTAKNSLQGLPPTFASGPPCATFGLLVHVDYPDTVKNTYNMMLDLGQKKKNIGNLCGQLIAILNLIVLLPLLFSINKSRLFLLCFKMFVIQVKTALKNIKNILSLTLNCHYLWFMGNYVCEE